MSLWRTLRYARRYRNWREIMQADFRRAHPRCVVLRNGVEFAGPEDVNPVRGVNGVYFKRYYTPPGFEIGPQDHVIDIGANIGVFSVYAASRTQGRVLAIEPYAPHVEFLRRNLERNRCAAVEIKACAVSDRAGTAKLFLGAKGVTHQLSAWDEQGQREAYVEVPTQNLEHLAGEQGFDRIDLLKLDCEGAEGLILPSLQRAFLQRIRRIAMEFHDSTSPLDHTALTRLLEENGYRVRLRWDGVSTSGLLYAWRS